MSSETVKSTSKDETLRDRVSDRIPELSNRQKIAAGVGVAAAMAAGLAAIRAARAGAGEGSKSVYHLQPDGEIWKLTLEGASGAEAHFDTKDEGLTAARSLANEQAPSELVVHRTDGTIQDRHRYEA